MKSSAEEVGAQSVFVACRENYGDTLLFTLFFEYDRPEHKMVWLVRCCRYSELRRCVFKKLLITKSFVNTVRESFED